MKEFTHTKTLSNGYGCYVLPTSNWSIEFRIKDGHGRLLYWRNGGRGRNGGYVQHYFNYEGGEGNFAAGFDIPLYIIDFIEYLFRKHEQYVKERTKEEAL